MIWWATTRPLPQISTSNSPMKPQVCCVVTVRVVFRPWEKGPATRPRDARPVIGAPSLARAILVTACPSNASVRLNINVVSRTEHGFLPPCQLGRTLYFTPSSPMRWSGFEQHRSYSNGFLLVWQLICFGLRASSTRTGRCG
jgi:hypothetical protein